MAYADTTKIATEVMWKGFNCRFLIHASFEFFRNITQCARGCMMLGRVVTGVRRVLIGSMVMVTLLNCYYFWPNAKQKTIDFYHSRYCSNNVIAAYLDQLVS